MTCDHPHTFAGRVNATRRCCRVREISNMPKAVRQAHYDHVRAECGEAALQDLIKEVQAEYRRKGAAQLAPKTTGARTK